MKKALTYMGNSFVIVIDRPICKLMGIGHGSVVKLSFEDGRLIVERTGEAVVKSPRAPRVKGEPPRTVRDPHEPMLRTEGREYSIENLQKFSRAVIVALIDRGLGHYLDRVHFEAGVSPTMFLRVADRNLEDAPLKYVVLQKRLRAIWDVISREGEWDDAIEDAIRRYPWPSNEDISAGSGADAVTVPPSG